jgi:hypothetical protein
MYTSAISSLVSRARVGVFSTLVCALIVGQSPDVAPMHVVIRKTGQLLEASVSQVDVAVCSRVMREAVTVQGARAATFFVPHPCSIIMGRAIRARILKSHHPA